jgi:DNA-binding IclR family transcriptional regulator
MLASWAFGQIDLRRELRWAEEELHERTDETVQLSVLAGRDAVCIDSIPSNRPVVTIGSVGAVWPAHMSSTGLAMLADDEAALDEYLREPLERRTPLTVTNPDKLRKLVQQFRVQGYAVNPGYFREEVCAVAAVVHDATGKTAAALGVMLPQFRMQMTTPEALGAIVVDVARRASERLGWGHPDTFRTS